MNFWKRKIKDVNEISKATGIDQEKIKELKEGKREIKGETMEKVLNAINETNKKSIIEKQVEEEQVLRWIKETDIKQLVKEFNFDKLNDCAEKIGISSGSFSNIINGKYNFYSKTMQKIYDFFQDEFNKNVKTAKVKPTKETPMLDYFRKTNLKAICNKLGYKNQVELAKEIGISDLTLRNMFNIHTKTDTQMVEKAYNFIKPKLDAFENDNREVIEWFNNADFKQLMKTYKVTYQDISNQINCTHSYVHNIINNKRSDKIKIIKQIYDYFKVLENGNGLKLTKTPQISTKEENSINILEDTKTNENEHKNDKLERVNKIDTEEKEKLFKLVMEKQERIYKLEKQIERYEKLIDRL